MLRWPQHWRARAPPDCPARTRQRRLPQRSATEGSSSATFRLDSRFLRGRGRDRRSQAAMIRLPMNSASRSLSLSKTPRPCWDRIDVVLLDMDGTLLDLRFDNYFWQDLVPERFAALHGLTLEAARQALIPRFAARQGTLDWYCIDFWTRELGL